MAGLKITFEVLSIEADETVHTPHLILPMEVDGEMLCPLYHGGRMTTAKVTNFNTPPYINEQTLYNSASITSPGGPWTGIERPGIDEALGDVGEFTFAVPCGGVLNCKWVFTDEAGAAEGIYGATADGRVYVNGVDIMTFGPWYAETAPSEGYFTIPLTCRPCGNLITIFFLGTEYPG